MKKIPYGIIAGACAMIFFYATVGLIAAHIIMNGVAQQVGDTTSFFGSWWQILLFIVDIIVFAGLVYGLVMFIKTKTNKKQEEVDQNE